MEAGGFEPPSRNISGRASTCLVAFLSLDQAGAKRQAPAVTSSRLISPLRHEQPANAIPLFDALYGPARKKPYGRAAYLGRHSQL